MGFLIGTGLLLGSLFILTGFLWVRERRYLRKKTSETMSADCWDEIVEEREGDLRRRRLFRKALEEARMKTPPS